MNRLLTVSTIAAATAALAPSAHAASESVETEVHATTTTLDIELNEETVLCSQADYSGPVLKVLIPGLAGVTLLDHQNFGAGAPCVAAGACAPIGDASPADVLVEGQPSETVEITVRAVRIENIDHDAETCDVDLREDVALQIRGVPFSHQRWASLGSRPYSDCLLSEGTEPSPEPTDEEPDVDPEPEPEPPKTDTPYAGPAPSGGCAAAGGAGGGAMWTLLLLGLFARRRRA